MSGILYFDSLLVRGPQKCISSCIPLINGFGYFDIIDRLKSSMKLLVVHLDTHEWGAESLVNNDIIDRSSKKYPHRQ